MLVELLKSKIHRVTVTEANLSYIERRYRSSIITMGLASRPTSSLESEDQVSSASTELQPVWCSLAIP